jgi:hypothetical protein
LGWGVGKKWQQTALPADAIAKKTKIEVSDSRAVKYHMATATTAPPHPQLIPIVMELATRWLFGNSC